MLVHLLDNRRKSRRFIRRNDYYVKSVLNEIFYILDLFCIAVISRTDFDNSILVKHNLTVYLVVHFHAPVVLAALRHSYLVGSAIGTAGQKEEKSQ